MEYFSDCYTTEQIVDAILLINKTLDNFVELFDNGDIGVGGCDLYSVLGPIYKGIAIQMKKIFLDKERGFDDFNGKVLISSLNKTFDQFSILGETLSEKFDHVLKNDELLEDMDDWVIQFVNNVDWKMRTFHCSCCTKRVRSD